jgi:predicted PurR-regulated permease PerM
MSLQRQVLFWLAALGVLVVLLLVFQAILLPFIAGMALAYALDPVADWLERRGFSRLAATGTIIVLFILLFIAALLLLVPVLVNQVVDFVENIPAYAERLQGLFAGLLNSRFASVLGIDAETVKGSLGGLLSQGTTWLTGILTGLVSGGAAVISVVSVLVVTPVVAFYLLYDWDRMIAVVDSWIPRDHVDTVRELANDMDRTTAAFVRGQGLTCVILGLIYAGGLAIVGLNFGLLIGLVAGLVSFIPYLGFTVGFIVSIIVALVQFLPDWMPIGGVVIVFIIGQLIEGYVLQPNLIGKSVGLHPVWLLFALFAFGLLFGFVGLLIAIPASASIGVLVRFALSRYLTSPIYRGETEEAPPKAAHPRRR